MNYLSSDIQNTLKNIYSQGYTINMELIAVYKNKHGTVLKERWRISILNNIPHMKSISKNIVVRGFNKNRTLCLAIEEWKNINDFTIKI